jgi:hypothetical protein
MQNSNLKIGSTGSLQAQNLGSLLYSESYAIGAVIVLLFQIGSLPAQG